MAKTTLSTIKNWFRTGLKPTQIQFWAVFDSFYHKDEKIQVSSVDQLSSYLDNKAEKLSFEIHLADDQAHVDLFNLKVDKSDFAADHYGSPVANLAALAFLTQADISTQQRRYVHSEGVDFFYDAALATGDVAPADQVGGLGFWMRGAALAEIIDNLTSTETGIAGSANQLRVLKGLFDANSAKFSDYILLTEKGTANGVAILDSNGVLLDSQLGDLGITDTLTPPETTLAAFATNNAAYAFQKGDVIIIDDGTGNVSHYIFKSGDKTLESSYSQLNATKIPVSAVIGLQAELDKSVKLLGDQTVAGIKTFTDLLTIEKSLVVKHGHVAAIAGFLGISAPFADAVGFSNAGSQAFNFRLNLLNATRNLTIPNKDGTLALLSDLASLAPSSRPTKLIDNVTQYTLVLEDKENHLKIINPIDLIAPSGVFSDGDEISFKNYSGGDVTMIEGANAALEVVSSQQMKVPSKGFGGMRYESAVKAGVFGQLKPI